jgi:hypothetical protein
MHYELAMTIDQAGQVLGGGADVDLADVHVPVFMSTKGCTKPAPFFDGENRLRSSHLACASTW